MFKVGDRVIELGRNCYRGEPIEVIEVISNSKRCLLKYHTVFNVLRNNMEYWVHEDDIILDKEYYRNKKIEEVLS